MTSPPAAPTANAVTSPRLRIARPVTDLVRAATMYMRGLGLQHLGGFEDHAGFDGTMVGEPGRDFHLEFTRCRSHTIEPRPTPEDLLVFYVPDARDWRARCEAMLAAGFAEVESFNPYWRQHGRTFKDPDGYRVVIQQAAWR